MQQLLHWFAAARLDLVETEFISNSFVSMYLENDIRRPHHTFNLQCIIIMYYNICEDIKIFFSFLFFIFKEKINIYMYMDAFTSCLQVPHYCIPLLITQI